MVGTVCCAVARDEPGTLQVGHLRQLSQKGLLHFKAVRAPCLRVLRRADERAQGDERITITMMNITINEEL